MVTKDIIEIGLIAVAVLIYAYQVFKKKKAEPQPVEGVVDQSLIAKIKADLLNGVTDVKDSDVAKFLSQVKVDVDQTMQVNVLLRLRHRANDIPNSDDKNEFIAAVNKLLQLTVNPRDTTLAK